MLARGNFEVSAKSADGQASQFEVLSKSGGTLDIRYPNVAQAVIKTKDDQAVDFVASGTDQISIKSTKGQTYVVTKIPAHVRVVGPADLKIEKEAAGDQIKLSWTASVDAASYKVYRAVGNAPDYELIGSEVASTDFLYKAADSERAKQMTFKVTAVRADGRESGKGAAVVLTR